MDDEIKSEVLEERVRLRIKRNKELGMSIDDIEEGRIRREIKNEGHDKTIDLTISKCREEFDYLKTRLNNTIINNKRLYSELQKHGLRKKKKKMKYICYL